MTIANHHYFAASQECFSTDLDLENIIDKMKLEGCNFVVWYVPLPLRTDYAIVLYKPQVEGAHPLSSWTYTYSELETRVWSNAPYQ
jgi:hypothetical protein